MKRTVAKASLQRPLENQILTVNDMFQFCTQNLGSKIKSFLTSAEEIEETEQQLTERFEGAKRIPGTRKYPKFLPVSETQMIAHHISNDNEGDLKYVTGDKENLNAYKDVKVGSYVVCIYNGQKYVGIVESYNSEFEDFLINFMTPKGFSKYYTFPEVKDSCNIISEDIIGTLNCPNLKAGTSRVQYEFKDKELKKLMN